MLSVHDFLMRLSLIFLHLLHFASGPISEFNLGRLGSLFLLCLLGVLKSEPSPDDPLDEFPPFSHDSPPESHEPENVKLEVPTPFPGLGCAPG
jgi:hypothetical protein